MRIKDKKKRTKFILPSLLKLLKVDTTRKFLSHSYFYKVSGEDLPERHEKRWIAKIVWSLISFSVLFL